ncbi:PIN domain-containing protein [Candidatus Mycobacterium methanotrophicum]|uniref:PIN domain-containing protein n=1 Tax=Candidatus Mycobacterium methanotrophicum TaxID=2943498 RepID=A0ABY4QGA5_9MYCO|nr:PIN domain-containing protein [Candidatus Mycobacterium methanotrophicum]UQX10032.1 PIN domain-containing protein [Candidatus Mycobacterium methanotrophicum]
MARVLLDSTVLIDALRGRPAADRLRALRRRGDEPWTCAISVEEIWRGVVPGEETAARRLVRGLRCAPLGAAEGVLAGGWRRQFAARGITLHQADCLIAKTALILMTFLAVLSGLGLVLAGPAAASTMPACCYSPASRWDERCVGARFSMAPGTESDDPGTWGGYSPWQGDCQEVGPNFSQPGYTSGRAPTAVVQAARYKSGPAVPPAPAPGPPPMCLPIDPTPIPHLAYAPCGWTKEADGHWHAPWNL